MQMRCKNNSWAKDMGVISISAMLRASSISPKLIFNNKVLIKIGSIYLSYLMLLGLVDDSNEIVNKLFERITFFTTLYSISYLTIEKAFV